MNYWIYYIGRLNVPPGGRIMGRYKIKKVLNNNVVIADIKGESVILVGKAIGFDYKKGELLPENRVENTFVRKVENVDGNYKRILENIDNSIVGISEEIINMCERKLNVKLNSALHISLPDHINFAMRRLKQGIRIENPFINELAALYPSEYTLASKAISMINERFNVNLTEDEIGFICMHIRAALEQQEVSDTLAYTKKIGEIMTLISRLIKKDINKNSLEYARTVTHINFMLDRVIEGKTIKNYLLDSIKKELYNEYDLAIKVSMKIENLFSVKIPEDEKGYIALHLKRLTDL